MLDAPGQPDALDHVIGRRFAYHLHPVTAGGPPIPHAHCDAIHASAMQGVEADHGHSRAIEVELVETNQEFMALYASGRPPDCVGLRPLLIRRD